MTDQERLLFALEEIERLSLVVARLVAKGVLSPKDLAWAEQCAQASRADRQAKIAPRGEEARRLRLTAARLRERAAALEEPPQ